MLAKPLQTYLQKNSLEASSFENTTHTNLCVDIPNCSTHISKILGLSPISSRMRSNIINGYENRIKANGELHGSINVGGLDRLYQGYQIYSAIHIANRALAGDTRIEIGMKYPSFDAEEFLNLFAADIVTAVPLDPNRPDNNPDYYSLFRAESGAIFTFAKDAIGRGGYAGAILTSEDEAFLFLNWLTQNPEHYLKDLDIGTNGLGGYGIRTYDLWSKTDTTKKVVEFKKPLDKQLAV